MATNKRKQKESKWLSDFWLVSQAPAGTGRESEFSFVQAVLEVHARPSSVQAQDTAGCLDLELRREGWAGDKEIWGLMVYGRSDDLGIGSSMRKVSSLDRAPEEPQLLRDGWKRKSTTLPRETLPRVERAPAGGCGPQDWISEKPSRMSPGE